MNILIQYFSHVAQLTLYFIFLIFWKHNLLLKHDFVQQYKQTNKDEVNTHHLFDHKTLFRHESNTCKQKLCTHQALQQ